MKEVKELARQVGMKLIVAAISIPLFGAIGYVWGLYQTDPPPILVGVLMVLSVGGFLATLFFYYRWQESREETRQPVQSLNDGLQEHGQMLAEVHKLLSQSPLFAHSAKNGLERRRFDDFLQITKKELDEDARSLWLEFTNRGDRPFRVKRVRYSGDFARSEVNCSRISSTDRKPALDFDAASEHLFVGDQA